jgi:GNAT superfamily N-acetyltransferase
MPVCRHAELQAKFWEEDTNMNIEIVNLTEENLIDAPEWSAHPFSCRYCIYWEYPEECVDPATEQKEEMFAKKLIWLQRMIKGFGNCGKLLYADGKSIGYAQYAPPRHLPNSADYDSGPPSDDAVLISCLFIAQEQSRGLGLGSQLLHSIVDELRERGIKAIETFGRKGNPENTSGPVEFYLKNGFGIHKDDKEFPLMRLDL